MDSGIFKSYDIRGIYPSQLDEDGANKIAQAFLKLVSDNLKKPINRLRVAVCQDNRKSSQPLMDEVIKVFLEYGVEVDNLGILSINDYYFGVGNYKYDAGIMATASHNPPEYGGFKMTIMNTEYDDSIDFISGKALYEYVEKLSFPIDDEKSEGRLRDKDVMQDHLHHILSFVDVGKIKPLKVVADMGNGMMGKIIPELMRKLPINFVPLFAEPDGNFPNRPPNPLTANAHAKLAAKILEVGADFGAIFDVDGDRMFLVDEAGNFVRGDMVLCLLAKPMLEKNPGAGIAYNLICSHAVKDLVTKWGGRAIRSEVGYKNLARHMREQNGIMSGEVSAHFAFAKNFYADSGPIALSLAIQTISEDGRPLSEIIKDYQLYHKSDEMNFVVEDINVELDKFRQKYQANILDEIDGITVEFEDWWFNVRPSNTEPLLRVTAEANTKELLDEKIKELISLIDYSEQK